MEDRPRSYIKPMTPEELTDIGTAKYGKWGWQRRLAAELGINPNTVLRWKSGHTPISDTMAFRLRGGYEVGEKMEAPRDFRTILRTLARNPNLTVVEDGNDFRIVERDKIV